ncbi:NAD(P)/FAD-dependent oxidoreductase [Woeseia oceani]|uniref:Sulfide-quinone reductase n=1 Tax=Woeseia oceani TaxID=1548547 RepID=A0A193LDL9_9GAMM|nr:FAD/NAD(P)-binding oxidoreductase [Woeseia oceani]ANO50536.1 pyridine nucleotide-disulfide oxidoreductase [Woeseia oceani]
MSHVVVLGAGTGGVPAAYELRDKLGTDHEVTLINERPNFQFVPSNPWIAVGWRESKDITVDLELRLAKHGINFISELAMSIDAKEKFLTLADDTRVDYDYLVITTGPKLAFDEIPGLGPDNGHTHSICALDHSLTAWTAYQKFLDNPGPIVVGAVQGASCFGPAYEFILTLDADLRKRKLRDKVPMTFVTSEPYIGHMGLGGVGDSKGIMESEFRQHHIKWHTNASVKSVEAGNMHLTLHDDAGKESGEETVPFKFSMMLPAFRGVDAVAGVEGLCNPRGFVLIDEFQRNPTYPSIYSAGVCVAIPPVEKTPVPTGAPKTGYMIESMVSAIVENITEDMAGKTLSHKATWNAICLADMGDTGVAFVALPQIPPRNVTWAKKGKWVHVAKIAFEKYFLHKVRSGNVDPVYERYVLKALGIERLAPKRGDD